MNASFIIPNPSAFVSGGNTFNSALLTTLSGSGISCDIVPIDDFLDGEPTAKAVLIDSLYFDRISTSKFNDTVTIGLIHYLEILEQPKLDSSNDQLRFLHGLDYCICPSQFVHDRLLALGLNIDQLLVIQPAVKPFTRIDKPVSDKVKAIMVNNLTEIKGVREFLDALSNASIPPDYKITIVGDTSRDPDYTEACQTIVRDDHNLSKTVRFVGQQSPDSIASLMQTSNLFLSNSRFETFGIAIQEANQSGIPILIRTGGNATNHVNDNINGYTAPDSDSLVRTFERLIANPDQFRALQLSASQYHHPYSKSHSPAIEKLIEHLQ